MRRALTSLVLLVWSLAGNPAVASVDDDIDQDDGTMGSEFPHIPEPMVFDLVRPLGSPRGELEMNTLSQHLLNGGHVQWAPEIEYVVADGLAVELELPFDNLALQDYKLAVQGTLPEHSDHFAHGWQLIGRHLRHDSSYSLDGLYIAGHRLSQRWSLLNMLGFRVDELGGAASAKGLANVNFFYGLNQSVALGLEVNNQFCANRWGYLLVPQLHAKLTEQLGLQLGAGYQKLGPAAGGFIVSHRLIYTF